MRRPYSPRPGTLTERAVEFLASVGPQRATILAQLLSVDRRSLYMSLKAPIAHGLVVHTNTVAGETGPGKGNGVESIYAPVDWIDDDEERILPVRRAASGIKPSAIGIAFAHPFGGAWA